VWSNIFMTANIQPGEVLLVHGGGSGIGTMAVQLGREVGARVAVTAGSPEKLEVCRELGASILVNYRTEDFEAGRPRATDGHGADVILDTIGAKYLARNVGLLAVTAGSSSSGCRVGAPPRSTSGRCWPSAAPWSRPPSGRGPRRRRR
jgi:NADPH:quinone reductase-like Zn-dependent oxidoreductase